jgi:CRISPR system Cascade subunit CasB
MSSLLERLRKHKNDRGMMANLRCILVESKKHRAWPILNRVGVAIDDDVAAFVAGLYATYPDGDSDGSRNFGVSCKSIERARSEATDKDKKLTPTERRFQHLLAADRDEVQDRVMRMVLLAKSQGVAVNYGKLLHDLKRWEYARTEWAAAFWTPGVPPADGEAP